jgi:hypothetical protein
MGKEPFDMITVIDEQKYERMSRNHRASWGSDVDDWIETGHNYDDYMRMCWVVNVGVRQGTIPLIGGSGVYNEAKSDWDIRPLRGLKQAIEIMLKAGCLRPTRSISRLTGHHERDIKELCAPMARLYGDI